MLRSLINSVRGRSAVTNLFDDRIQPVAFTYEDLSPAAASPDRAPATAAPALPPATATIGTVRPDRCCLYCGHPLYAPPRVPRLRCPKCFADLPVKDITLSGEVDQPQILTAGKIVVAADGRVAAELVACTIDIAGMVMGQVLASHTCRVRPTGKVAGRILCRHLQLEEGAQVEGAVELVRG